jgi:hypothetical protein
MCASFRKPDLKAPRFREKKFNILSKQLFAEFREKYKEHKDMSYEQFKDIITAFNNNLYKGVIDNRNGIELPEGLGFIFIGTCPPTKKTNIDYKKSTEYGVITNHKNWDSNNNLMKIFYTNSKVKYHLQNKQLWAFEGVRDFKRTASKTYRDEWTKYVVVDKTKRISAMIDKVKKKQYAVEITEKQLANYDEFKM